MSAAPRKLLTRGASLASRTAVYETAEGLEVESKEQYDTVHRRVLYEDAVSSRSTRCFVEREI